MWAPRITELESGLKALLCSALPRDSLHVEHRFSDAVGSALWLRYEALRVEVGNYLSQQLMADEDQKSS
jgi:hypothetical protein